MAVPTGLYFTSKVTLKYLLENVCILQTIFRKVGLLRLHKEVQKSLFMSFKISFVSADEKQI